MVLHILDGDRCLSSSYFIILKTISRISAYRMHTFTDSSQSAEQERFEIHLKLRYQCSILHLEPSFTEGLHKKPNSDSSTF